MAQQLRRSILEELEGDTYNSWPLIPADDWRDLHFKSMVLDEADGHTITETDHPDGYNMILVHPVTHALIWAYTIDFEDYVPPKQTFIVRYKHSEIRAFEMEADSLEEACGNWLEASFGKAEPVQWLDEELISVTMVTP